MSEHILFLTGKLAEKNLQRVLADYGMTPCYNERDDLFSTTPSGEAVSWKKKDRRSGWYISCYENEHHMTVELLCAFASDGLLRNDEAIEVEIFNKRCTYYINSNVKLNQFVRRVLRPALTV